MSKRRKLTDFNMKIFLNEVIDDILLDMHMCPECGDLYEGYSQFCSRSCLNDYLYEYKRIKYNK